MVCNQKFSLRRPFPSLAMVVGGAFPLKVLKSLSNFTWVINDSKSAVSEKLRVSAPIAHPFPFRL